MTDLQIQNEGLISYDEALEKMMALHGQRVRGQIPDTILFLQHDPPVITKGRRLHQTDLVLHPTLQQRGVQVRNADRGGQLTYHGPGQIVVYFIVKFSDRFESIRHMISSLEQTLLDYLKEWGLEARTDQEHPGVWVGEQKVASIGLRVADGVTRHGISLNVNNPLDVYGLFDPCGMSGAVMTNLESLLSREFSAEDVTDMAQSLAHRFFASAS